MTGRAGPAPAAGALFHGLAGPKAEKPISLALQGGGAHGAYTWGVLDRILEDGRLAIEAITGTSAGSMNAVVLADGWAEGGPDGARAKLSEFWRRVSLDGNLTDIQRLVFDRVMGLWSFDGTPAAYWLSLWRQAFSPYETNPLDLNPLRDLLHDLVDFDKVRASPLKLFIAATSVWTGKVRVFETSEIGAKPVLASACLPMVFQAVEIDGEPFWDGGYSGNPALFPLFYRAHCDDILLVQINPIERRTTPTDPDAIQDRMREISFNAGLIGELRVIDFVGRLVREGKLSDDDYKHVLMHRIGGDQDLARFPASTRGKADWTFFQTLRDLGREAAGAWLAENYDHIGEVSTLDLQNTIRSRQEPSGSRDEPGPSREGAEPQPMRDPAPPVSA